MPRAQQAPEETCGDRVPGAQGFALTVSYPVVPGATAEELAGVCPGPAVTLLCRSCRLHRRGGQRQPCAPVVSGQESGLVCGARRPADASDEHSPRSSAQRDGPKAIHDERVSSSRGQPTSVSHGVSAPLQPDTVSAPGQACRPMWCGSGGWMLAHKRLVPQCANPYIRRLSMNCNTFYH